MCTCLITCPLLLCRLAILLHLFSGCFHSLGCIKNNMNSREDNRKDGVWRDQNPDAFYNAALVRSIQREELSSQCTMKHYVKCIELLDEKHDRDVFDMLRAQNRVHMSTLLPIMQRSIESTALRSSENPSGTLCVPCARR